MLAKGIQKIGDIPGSMICSFVYLFTISGGLWWKYRLTKDGTYATQGRPKRASLKAGKRNPPCVPETDPSLGRVPGDIFALQSPCPY